MGRQVRRRLTPGSASWRAARDSAWPLGRGWVEGRHDPHQLLSAADDDTLRSVVEFSRPAKQAGNRKRPGVRSQ
jgi:hypothetical protein